MRLGAPPALDLQARAAVGVDALGRRVVVEPALAFENGSEASMPRPRRQQPVAISQDHGHLYLLLAPLLDDLGDTLGERRLAPTSQHRFERHPDRARHCLLMLLPAPDRAVLGDQERSGHRTCRQSERFATTVEHGGFGHFGTIKNLRWIDASARGFDQAPGRGGAAPAGKFPG